MIFSKIIHIPYSQALDLIVQDSDVDRIVIDIVPFYPRPPEAVPNKKTRPVNFRAITPIFIEFFENYSKWLNQHALATQTKAGSKSYILWPNAWQFARIVRNAVSHEGIVNIDNTTFTPVTWHSLTYGPAQSGRTLLGRDLAIADLIFLMIEMSDELDRLGCTLT